MKADNAIATVGIASFLLIWVGLLLAIWTGDARWAATAGVAFLLSLWMWLSTVEGRRKP